MELHRLLITGFAARRHAKHRVACIAASPVEPKILPLTIHAKAENGRPRSCPVLLNVDCVRNCQRIVDQFLHPASSLAAGRSTRRDLPSPAPLLHNFNTTAIPTSIAHRLPTSPHAILTDHFTPALLPPQCQRSFFANQDQRPAAQYRNRLRAIIRSWKGARCNAIQGCASFANRQKTRVALVNRQQHVRDALGLVLRVRVRRSARAE